MNLQHLCSATHAEVYFDRANGWVFVDWMGDLTLDTVQHACLGIARCFLDHHYPRVLNSNEQVTSLTPAVSAWLASDFLPAMNLTGVEQMAWVIPPTLRARNNVLNTVNLFPHIAINLFENLAEAVSWLQQTAPTAPTTGCFLPGRLYTEEIKLRRLVTAFAKQLEASDAPAETAQYQ